MLNLKTSRICCVFLSSPVGCINVLISFITRTSIKMLSWKKARIIKYITDNRKIVIRLVASIWKKKSLNLHKKWNPLCSASQRAPTSLNCHATTWFIRRQEEWKLERSKATVGILLKDGRHLAMKISNNRQSWYRK